MIIGRSIVARVSGTIALTLSLCGCIHDMIVIQTNAPMVMSRARMDRIQSRSFELLESCSFENDAAIASDEIWNQHAERHHTRFTFAGLRQAQVMGETLGVTKLLIPRSTGQAPPYVFVRSHDRIRAFSKYDPQ